MNIKCIYIYIPFYPAVYTVRMNVSKPAKNTTVRFNLPKMGTFMCRVANMHRTVRKSAKILAC